MAKGKKTGGRNLTSESRALMPGRSTDRIPRGSVKMLCQTLMDDDGTLEESLAEDKSFRARVAKSLLKAADDERLVMKVVESMSTILEGTTHGGGRTLVVQLGPQRDPLAEPEDEGVLDVPALPPADEVA